MRILENSTFFLPFDFVRLIRSSVPFVPGGAGLPSLVPAHDLESRSFAEAGLSDLLIEITSFFSFLFGAPG